MRLRASSIPGTNYDFDIFRTRICDPDFKSCDVVKIASKEYAAKVAANITDVGLGLH